MANETSTECAAILRSPALMRQWMAKIGIDIDTITGTVPGGTADGQLLIWDNTALAYVPHVISGDATLTKAGLFTLATVNSNVGTFGDATDVAQLTVNGKGLVTAAASVPIVSLLSATYGDGSDATLVYDGAATILGVAPVANVYTLTRDIFPQTMTVNSGVTVNTGGFRIYVKGTLTIQSTGIVGRPGNAGGTGNAAGAALAPHTLAGGAAGGAGFATGSGGNQGGNVSIGLGGGGGNGGSTPTPRAAGPGGTVTAPGADLGTLRAAPSSISGMLIAANTSSASTTVSAVGGGAGGGSGGCDTSSSSGSGGSGGGVVLIAALAITNAGTITVAGGNGGNASGTQAGAGGGGGGGLLVITTSSASVGSTNVTGGAHGTATGSGTVGTNGSAGTLISITN